jgi:glycosyltransferase involved in cell wall biosynthesis
MPVFNPHPVYFREAVQSILRQTLEDFELVVVEAPSARPAAEVLADLHDPRIRHYLTPPLTSLAEQRNQGLHLARADLVALFDADDLCARDRLEKQVAYLADHPEVDILGSQVRVIDGAGKTRGFRSCPVDHEAIVDAMPRFNPLAQPSVLLRKAVVLAHGGYHYDGYPPLEDYDLWCRLALAGDVRFAVHPEPLFFYRMHDGQIKATGLRGTIRETVKVKMRYWRGQMDLGARARLWAERLLLLLPPRLVMYLLIRIRYRDDAKFLNPERQGADRLPR